MARIGRVPKRGYGRLLIQLYWSRLGPTAKERRVVVGGISMNENLFVDRAKVDSRNEHARLGS